MNDKGDTQAGPSSTQGPLYYESFVIESEMAHHIIINEGRIMKAQR